jgi:hypothetical protein
VVIAIYDVSGRRVRTLVDEFLAATDQTRSVQWNGMNGNGTRAASGVFFVRMAAAGAVETRKIVLLK